MLQIALLDGPYAGQVRTSADLTAQGVTPEALLIDLAQKGWRWQIIWPPRPEQSQAWAEDWLADRLKVLREDFGVDLADRISISAEAPDEDEILAWVKADLIGRIFLAALHQRAVRFLGKRWEFPDCSTSPEEFGELMGEIEDAIVNSGRNVGVFVDDGENDLVIGVYGYEE